MSLSIRILVQKTLSVFSYKKLYPYSHTKKSIRIFIQKTLSVFSYKQLYPYSHTNCMRDAVVKQLHYCHRQGRMSVGGGGVKDNSVFVRRRVCGRRLNSERIFQRQE